MAVRLNLLFWTVVPAQKELNIRQNNNKIQTKNPEGYLVFTRVIFQ